MTRRTLSDDDRREALRSEAHPLVGFNIGASGRRQPMLVGTRLYIHQIIATLRASDGDVDATATYFGLRPQSIRAALAYYADFADEVDDDAAVADRIEREEQSRWESERESDASTDRVHRP